MPMRHVEKRHHLLAQMGAHVASQRIKVFREDLHAFANRLRLFGADQADAASVEAIERGDGQVPFELWMAAFQAMQVADAVARASKNDAALFLAAAEFASGIEAEMRSALNSGDSGAAP